MQELSRNMRFIIAEQVEIKSEIRRVRHEIKERRETVTFDQCSSVHEIKQMETRLRASSAATESLVVFL